MIKFLKKKPIPFRLESTETVSNKQLTQTLIDLTAVIQAVPDKVLQVNYWIKERHRLNSKTCPKGYYQT